MMILQKQDRNFNVFEVFFNIYFYHFNKDKLLEMDCS